MKPGSITVWQVGFDPTHMLTEFESLPVPDDISYQEPTLFHPTLSRLAFLNQGNVLIWDAHDSKLLLNSSDGHYYPMMSFSSDGQFFVVKVQMEKHISGRSLPLAIYFVENSYPVTEYTQLNHFSPQMENQ